MNRSPSSFRVLSIQSHVVSGYVGNKCAVFPLQLLGFEVDFINSVQLSNHTGYDHVLGQVLNATELHDLVEGLKLNNIHHYSHLLTGYVGSASFLKEIVETVRDLRLKSPTLTYVCDPVLGDNGKLYVPEENVPIYRDLLIPLADVVTPNQFETELITQMKIVTEADVFRAMDWFHQKGVKLVVITSTSLENQDKGQMIGFASHSHGTQKDKERYQFEIPKISGTFTGTGDLFAALFMAWLAKTGGNLQATCERTASSVFHILKKTLSYNNDFSSKDNMQTAAKLELQLINSKQEIEDPEVVVSVRKLS